MLVGVESGGGHYSVLVTLVNQIRRQCTLVYLFITIIKRILVN